MKNPPAAATQAASRPAPGVPIELVMEVVAGLEVVVELDDGRTVRPLRARELSPRGLFVKTDEVLPLRRIVRVQIPLDDELGEPIAAMAVVTRRVTVADARAQGILPGIGIELRGLGRQGTERWTHWLRALAQRYAPPTIPVGRPLRRPSAHAFGPAVPPRIPLHLVGDHAPPADAVRRQHVRYELAWEAHLELDGQQLSTQTSDLSAGGACLLSPCPIAPGTALHVQILSPDGIPFAQPARVVRQCRVDRLPAIGVVFVDMTPVRHRQLERFILAGLPEEEAEMLDEDTDEAWAEML